MILLTNGVSIPHQQAIITLIEKPPAIVQQVKPELTVEEKIKLNYYKCDTNIQYIRADNATCLAKPVQTPQTTTKAQKPVKSSQNSSVSVNGNGYGNDMDYGFCTWFVKENRPDLPSGLGNANTWYARAQAWGLPVGNTPRVGAVATTTRGSYGHVSLVAQVDGNRIFVREMNVQGLGVVSSAWYSAADYLYIY